MDFQFGASDVRIIEQARAYSGHTLIALQWLQIHGDALAQRWS